MKYITVLKEHTEELLWFVSCCLKGFWIPLTKWDLPKKNCFLHLPLERNLLYLIYSDMCGQNIHVFFSTKCCWEVRQASYCSWACYEKLSWTLFGIKVSLVSVLGLKTDMLGICLRWYNAQWVNRPSRVYRSVFTLNRY